MQSRPTEVAVSVVIPCYRHSVALERCLESVVPQALAVGGEVIVVDSSDDDGAVRSTARFPSVELVRSEGRLFPGDARNRGVERASAAILVFVDADCVPADDWLSAVVTAHAELPHPVIGGVIDNTDRTGAVGWASYFTEIAEWMPGRGPVEIGDVAGACWTMKRWAYEQFGPFEEGVFSSDTAFNWAVVRSGHRLARVPSIRVVHSGRTSLRDMWRRNLQRGRSFAAVRAATTAFSRPRRAAYALAAPLLPMLLLLRRARIVMSRRTYRRRFLAVSPLVLFGLVAWSLGESLGYAFGQGRR